jgi:hypothetical protein
MGLPELLRRGLYYDTWRSLHAHGPSLQSDRSTSMYMHVHDQTDNATYASNGWVPAVGGYKEALPCVRRYSFWVPAVRGGGIIFLCVIRRHFLACKDVDGGSSYQLHRVQSSSDGCHSLTTLTMPRREHQGSGRRRVLGRELCGVGEDATVDAHAEGSTRVDLFGCGVRLPSPENNKGCG